MSSRWSVGIDILLSSSHFIDSGVNLSLLLPENIIFVKYTRDNRIVGRKSPPCLYSIIVIHNKEVIIMLDCLYDNGLLHSQEELRALITNGVKSFGDLQNAADREPRVLKPLLNRYIKWFNSNVVPVAVNAVSN
mgnify:CR=1 FL=1